MFFARRKTAAMRLAITLLAAGAMAVGIGLSPKPVWSVDAAAASGRSDVFSQKIVPFVAQYCGDCHSGPKPERDLDLVKFKDAAEVAASRKTWRKVLGKLSAHEMPPADQEQPPAAEVEMVARWIDAELARPVPFDVQEPGRVTIRRLNRAEYNNTIRDLVGVDFHPAEDFPADDVGYGFDNIGDVLSLSPLLFEKYVTAAERIMNQAIVVARKDAAAADQDVRGGEARSDGESRADLSRLAADDEKRRAAASMEDALRRRLSDSGACPRREGGDDLPHMVVKVDDKEVKAFDVKIERMPPTNYECTTHLAAGEHRLAIAFTNDYHDPNAKDDIRRDRALTVSQARSRWAARAAAVRGDARIAPQAAARAAESWRVE